ncbi:MAG: Lrp/AsnC ligand binding domain-containing protein [Candidatus Parvarchaeota archaeon]|nr:Lrp/AsnC ligand binding domain-containing protein [Candidatus Parvarchaeota archaeon]MCW1295797.1 Lrp/AsnC ligand binding domain-containing protein [Candidatus Parvarchaeum tengchongense]MCW1299403.1 Lrp/AsnC ligand binding domain-containing protein [Candidatus Parvarchaeum tengchongense]MCW1312599.1 Lrp/AsnC ligand binding domain-containing protein [Candidatus Parvarchaeum tengchongense]
MEQMEALIFVEVSQGSSAIEIAKAVSSDEKVTEVMLISGQWDLLIRLKYSNIEELSNFVVSQLRKEKGVGRTDTTIVLNKVK